jgi:DNA-binding transcriptional MerR regulator
MEKDEHLDSAEFKASDLLKLARLTYRQLHDWENRAGIVESERAAPEGWRKFNLAEMLSLCVCTDLRRQFSLPLSEIGNIYRWLLGRKLDRVHQALAALGNISIDRMRQHPKIAKLLSLKGKELADALKNEENRYHVEEYCQQQINKMSSEPIKQAWKLAQLGLIVYIYTDFKLSLILPEANMIHAIATRLPETPTIIYPLNSIFNSVRKQLKLPPFPLDTFGPSFLEKLSQLGKDGDVSQEERNVLALLRSKKYGRITVHLKDGDVIRANAEETLSKVEQQKIEKSIQKVIEDHGYQTLTMNIRDGKSVHLKRDVSINLKR